MTPSQTKEKNSKSPLNKGGLEKLTKITLFFHFLGALPPPKKAQKKQCSVSSLRRLLTCEKEIPSLFRNSSALKKIIQTASFLLICIYNLRIECVYRVKGIVISLYLFFESLG